MSSEEEKIIKKIDKLIKEGADLNHRSIKYNILVDQGYFEAWVAEIGQLFTYISDKNNPYVMTYDHILTSAYEEKPRSQHVRTCGQLLNRIKGEILEGTIQVTKNLNLESDPPSGLLPKKLLHPVIEQKIRSSFDSDDYDTAVFIAFKEVEVSVRKAGGFQDTDIGIDLMRKAFKVDGGPLTDSYLPKAESEALQHLFAGAIGLYKNSQSHRTVAITDPKEAAEIIIIASRLIKIVESRNSNQE